jgi:hypothetical protein
VRAQEAFDALVRAGVGPFLKERGFRRTRFNFHRQVSGNWQVVNLQKSAFSDAQDVRFTVNLGVALERLRGGVFDWPDGKRPPESRCHLRERLGFVMSGRDVWWTVSPDTDVVALAETITLGLERYGVPWLEERSSDEALLALVSDPEKLRSEDAPHHLVWFAQILAQLGEEDARQAVEAEHARREAELARARAKKSL